VIQLTIRDQRLRAATEEISRLCRDAGGRAWVVGGGVRDAMLGIPIVDVDLEVHGLEAEALETMLAAHFDLDAVGRSFGVLKLRGLALDVSLPRTESKAGLGHRGFLIESDPHLGLDAAARRRDFTINAMACDPLTGDLADPLDGRADLEQRVLRHCSAAFVEDPLRVLRAMQLVARFGLDTASETVALCRTIQPEGLASERIWHEWRKLLLQGVEPSRGLRLLADTGWLAHFPPLAALAGLPLDPDRHPEGDAYTHVGLCLDAVAASRVGDDHEDLVVGLAVLGHDLGRPLVQVVDQDGRIRAPGHAEAGEVVARQFVRDLTGQPALAAEVAPLVARHNQPARLFAAGASDGDVRRLARDVGRIDRLLRVVRADWAGRGAASVTDPPAAAWLEQRAADLGVLSAAPEPIVLGRHLRSRGLRPGPRFGTLLARCFDAQLDGRFADLDGGLAFLDGVLRSDRSD
jgi:tRNA nucleotidyltransferase (CCA-adding enzyme)